MEPISKNAPLSLAEIETALACLVGYEPIVLAVSGGPDSLALLFLAAEWQKRRANPPQILVATVDHGLRAESAAEAEFTAARSARLGLPHTALKWVYRDKPLSGLAEAARRARYELLEHYAATLEPGIRTAVVTAHTEDDQAETFLMRLARGSGVDGLAAMSPARPLSGGSKIALVRPFLGVPKTRLAASLEVRGETWCNDPSNTNDAYERVRIRNAAPALKAAGVDVSAIARSARRLQNARDALDYAAMQFEEQLHLASNNNIFASFDRRQFARGPRLLRERVIADLIGRHGGTTPPPGLLEIEALVMELERRDEAMMTLGGAVVSAGPRQVRIWREAGRISEGDLQLSPGVPSLWDNRFWVTADLESAGPVSVRALGAAGCKLLKGTAGTFDQVPGRAAAALPAFWSGGGLLAVPQLGVKKITEGGNGTFVSTAVREREKPL